MTIYISPNPGKTSANEIALRAAQILMNHGAQGIPTATHKLQHGRSGLSAAGGMP